MPKASYDQIQSEWAKAKQDFEKVWPRKGHKLVFVIHEGDHSLSNEDATDVVTELNMMKKRQPIDVIIHSPGGGAVASNRVAEALVDRHDTAAFVPFYAWSGGTKIALATEKIYLGKGATLSPMDIQLDTEQGTVPARTLVELTKRLGDNAPPDLRLTAANAEKLIAEEVENAASLINRRHKGGGWWSRGRSDLAKKLTSGEMHHSQPISYKNAKMMGMNVIPSMHDVIYEFISRRRAQLRHLRELESQVRLVQINQG